MINPKSSPAKKVILFLQFYFIMLASLINCYHKYCKPPKNIVSLTKYCKLLPKSIVSLTKYYKPY